MGLECIANPNPDPDPNTDPNPNPDSNRDQLHRLLRSSFLMREGLAAAVVAMERVAPTAEQVRTNP